MGKAVVSEEFKEAIRRHWGNAQEIAGAAHTELWRHYGEIYIGEDHDDQVSSALQLGVFVGQALELYRVKEGFIATFQHVFLDDDEREAWWNGKPL